MDGKLLWRIILALTITAQLCKGSRDNFTSVDDIIILDLPGSERESQETKCRLLTFQKEKEKNNSSDYCRNNINPLFGDIIDLTTNNLKLKYICKYQLDCSENKQCGIEHRGEFCKACKANYSRTFESDSCKQCSNLYLLLILPFAVAGIVLVFLILKCNLTVSTGQVNALIFYANVIHVYRKIQFERVDPYTPVFIAWLNLDLGIQTCFYDGMDDYARVWLQFVFPLYLWLLVGILFILVKVSPSIRKFLGGNCVPALSVTIIILTYSKILQTIKSALAFKWLNKTDHTMVLWSEDDTVPYLGQRHTALFVVALLVSFFYILPLTLIGIFAPCIQNNSKRRALKWIRKLKPFLDAYQAPYNDNFRSWTGLMLAIRIFIYVLFGVNQFEDPPMYYFLIVTIMGPISVFVLVKRNKTVYRRTFSNFLETVSLLNLTLLNIVSWFLTTTRYTRGSGKVYKQYLTYVSIGITLLLFLLVVLYQVSLVLCPQVYLKCRGKRQEYEERESEESMSSDGEELEVEVIRTNAEFRESQKDRLREPLIESSATPTVAPLPTAILY